MRIEDYTRWKKFLLDLKRIENQKKALKCFGTIPQR